MTTTGKFILSQSRAGSPNHYVEGVYSFPAAATGSAPKLGQHIDTFPILYQVGESPYWFGGKKVYVDLPLRARIEAERLLLADRVVDTCYLFTSTRMSCVGVDDDLAEVSSRDFQLPNGVQDVKDAGDIHIAATVNDHLHFFLMTDQSEVMTARVPAFEIPSRLARTSRSRTVGAAWPKGKTDDEN